MIWLIRRAAFFWKLAHIKDTPRRLALGLACGVLLGLVPKGNLLAIGIAMVVFATHVSLPVATASALGVSLFGTWLDPVTHRLGQAILTQPLLTPIWDRLYHVPLVAWTSFNNTVVMGNLFLGLVLLYPVYRLSLPWFVRYRHWVDLRTAGEQPDEPATDTAPAVPDAGVTESEPAPARPLDPSPAQRVIPRRATRKLRKCA